MTGYSISVVDALDSISIQKKWETLESKIDEENVFLSWFWIGNWLRQTKHLNPRLLEFKYKNTVIGLAFFCNHIKRVSGLPIRQSYINRTGLFQYDQPWIEFNDILTSEEHRQGCIQLFAHWLKEQPIDEWILSLTLREKEWQHLSDVEIETDTIPAYAVLLGSETSTLDTYLAGLTKNTRSTLRRALRYIEEQYGAISIQQFKNELTQTESDQLSAWHKVRWNKSSQKSGFFNSLFIDFHQYLQRNPTPNHNVETLVFYAGDTKIGYLYYLIGVSDIKFYLSAINYCNDNNRYQPGLVMHALAIVHYSLLGYKRYDFMGGDSQYKRSLSNSCYSLYSITLRPKTLINSCFRLLRKLKTRLS